MTFMIGSILERGRYDARVGLYYPRGKLSQEESHQLQHWLFETGLAGVGASEQ
jgi:hypothetical protein